MAQVPATGKTLLRRFEDAWQQGTPRLADFLTPAVSRELLAELVKIDLEYRWRRAGASAPVSPGPLPERPRLEDYLAHFPSLGRLEDVSADLIAAEYSVRHWVGDRPSHEEMLRRFPAQAERVRPELVIIDAEIAEDRPAEGSTEVAIPLPSRAPIASPADWWQALRDSSVLPPEQLDALTAEGLLNRDLTADGLARLLVEERYLTPFQAQLLLAGRGAALLLGPYVILEPIGEGLTSRVFRARHRLLNRTVALKVFRAELVRDVSPEVLERFTREMRALAPLSHENVVHAYDAGLAGATYYIAMQHVAGTDLQRLVRESGPLAVAQAGDYVRQVALGLAHIRQNGLVHRDLKPSNLMVTPPPQVDPGLRHPWGLVQILDLGMARLHWSERTRSLGTLTRHGQVMGTADYMAPEQALDPHRIDIRADLYSLGCTAYFLLTGRPPFPGGTLSQKLNKHMGQEPAPPESLRGGLPTEVTGIIRRLMAKRPEDRFQTPEEVASLLAKRLPNWPGSAQAGIAYPGRPIPQAELARLPDGAPRPTWRSKRVLLGAGAVLAVVALLLLGSWLVRGPRTPTTSDGNRSAEEKRKRYALEFDGTNNLVILPDNLIHDSRALTVELWFKTSTGGALFGYQHVPYPDRPSLNVPLLYVGQDGILRGAVWRRAVDPLAAAGRVNDGRWHHAALVTDGHTQSLFQDGKLVHTATGDVDHLTMSNNQLGMAFMSNWPGGTGTWFGFKGLIRDIRIWHVARTPAQIAEAMNASLTGKEKGLAAYYPCDEPGESLADRSSQQRHGKPGGGVKANRPKWVSP